MTKIWSYIKIALLTYTAILALRGWVAMLTALKDIIKTIFTRR